MNRVFLGLGTNIGNREENLRRARELLVGEGLIIEKESSIDETDPVDYLDQPAFLNQIIIVETPLDPYGLLSAIKNIERIMGRTILIAKGPRIIDIDILLFNDILFADDILEIPHPAICHRNFVLKHLCELEPDLIDPRSGIYYKEIYHGKEEHHNHS